MNASRANLLTNHVTGVLQCVDTLEREIQVLSKGARFHFDVPVGCAICLNGELVKLRLLQPGDQIQVAYELEKCGPIARSIQAGSQQVGPRQSTEEPEA
jgi:hypothetical protein